MVVARGTAINDDLEIRERQFVEAFAGGYADKVHFDNLADMRNVLMVGAAHKKDRDTLLITKAMYAVMQAIRERHAATGAMTATPDELDLMRAFAGVYRDFWMRQPVALFEAAVIAAQQGVA